MRICIFLYYILDGEMFALDVSITFTPMICDALKFDILNLNIINIIVVFILLNLILQALIKLHVLDIFINFIKKWLYTPKYIFYWWYVILLFPIFAVRTILKFIKKHPRITNKDKAIAFVLFLPNIIKMMNI